MSGGYSVDFGLSLSVRISDGFPSVAVGCYRCLGVGFVKRRRIVGLCVGQGSCRR